MSRGSNNRSAVLCYFRTQCCTLIILGAAKETDVIYFDSHSVKIHVSFFLSWFIDCSVCVSICLSALVLYKGYTSYSLNEGMGIKN